MSLQLTSAKESIEREREREREREVKSSLTQRIHFMETFSNLQIHRI